MQGHTHISGDKVIDGVRYVQNALGHPGEQNKFWHAGSDYGPKLVFDSAEVSSSGKCILQ